MIITETRNELAELLGRATGFDYFGHLPGNLAGRMVAVLPGTPWLRPGQTFGSFNISLEAHLILSGLNNREGTEAANDAVEDALIAAISDGWSVEAATPYALNSGGKELLAVQINLSRDIRL